MAIKRGTNKRNTLNGTNGKDSLFGLGGDDTLNGKGGNDKLFGGTGNDKLFGGAGNDTLDGGKGNDTLDGGTGSDVMKGGAGGDTFIVDSAGDVVVDSSGTDIVLAALTFTLGADIENLTLTGAASINGTGNTLANIITGNAGNNFIDGGAGIDAIDAGGGDDTVIGRMDGETLRGGSGSDTVNFSGIAESISASLDDESNTQNGVAFLNSNHAIHDTILGFENIIGTGFDDLLTGDSLANMLIGDAGNDILLGSWGDDLLSGGKGNDRIEGGNGSDWLIGDVGDDTFTGDDNLVGADKIDGGDGEDTIIANFASTVDLSGNHGGNAGGAFGDTYISIEHAQGSSGNDFIYGNVDAALTRLAGNAGLDQIFVSDCTAEVTAQYASIVDIGEDTVFKFAAFSQVGAGADKIGVRSEAGPGDIAFGMKLGATLEAADIFSGNLDDANPQGNLAQAQLLFDTNYNGDQRLYYDADGSGAGAAVALLHFVSSNFGASLDVSDITFTFVQFN